MTNRPEAPFASAAPAGETFADYVARYLVGRRGFRYGFVDEAEPLVAACDLILTRLDPLQFEIACLIDTERHPGKGLAIDAERVRHIARACLGYAGRLGLTKMPIMIGIYEVGPGADTAERRERLAAFRTDRFSKAKVFAWILDPERRSVWCSRPQLPWIGRSVWLKRLLRQPRLGAEDLAPLPVATGQGGWPIFTIGLLVLMVGVFAAEIVLGIDPATGLLRPSVRTLLAFGGLSRPMVIEQAEWWRLLTAPLLHADAGHIVFNGIALALVGWLGERLIGSAWFAAIFAVSALSGSLMSLAVNAPDLVGVGASGGIVGLFAATFVTGYRYPPGALRLRLHVRALLTLVPALIPIVSSMNGARIDYGAHFGGAIAGVLTGFVILQLWPRSRVLPRFGQLAAAGAGLFFLLAAVAIVPQAGDYDGLLLQTELYEPWPDSEAEARFQSASMLAAKPHDPRARFLHALALLDNKDFKGAERDLRAGLGETALIKSLGIKGFEARLRTLLGAVLIDEGQPDEARRVAEPACHSETSGPVRETLNRIKLCG